MCFFKQHTAKIIEAHVDVERKFFPERVVWNLLHPSRTARETQKQKSRQKVDEENHRETKQQQQL